MYAGMYVMAISVCMVCTTQYVLLVQYAHKHGYLYAHRYAMCTHVCMWLCMYVGTYVHTYLSITGTCVSIYMYTVWIMY